MTLGADVVWSGDRIKYSVGRPLARWSDDMRYVAGNVIIVGCK